MDTKKTDLILFLQCCEKKKPLGIIQEGEQVGYFFTLPGDNRITFLLYGASRKGKLETGQCRRINKDQLRHYQGIIFELENT